MIGAVSQDEDPDVSDEVKTTDWHGEKLFESIRENAEQFLSEFDKFAEAYDDLKERHRVQNMQQQLEQDVKALGQGRVPEKVAQAPAIPKLLEFIAPTRFTFDDGTVPMMPCMPNEPSCEAKNGIKHRQKFSAVNLGTPAIVAKPIPRKDWATDKYCQAAIENEWKGLENSERPVFDMKSVKNWRTVASDANAKGKTIHMARVFGIMVRKHAENPEIAVTKYRVVYQGNAVFIQNFEVAFCQDLGSSPVAIEGGHCVVSYGLFNDHVVSG